MGNSQQVAPPGEKPARRCAIPPALRGGSLSPLCLSFVKRPVRTRMRGVVGAGEGDLPGYPISGLSQCSSSLSSVYDTGRSLYLNSCTYQGLKPWLR